MLKGSYRMDGLPQSGVISEEVSYRKWKIEMGRNKVAYEAQMRRTWPDGRIYRGLCSLGPL